MLIAESYDEKLFAEKMQFVIDQPEASQKIGLTGKGLATKLFDYRYMAEELNEFLNNRLNGEKEQQLTTRQETR